MMMIKQYFLFFFSLLVIYQSFLFFNYDSVKPGSDSADSFYPKIDPHRNLHSQGIYSDGLQNLEKTQAQEHIKSNAFQEFSFLIC